MKKKLIKTFIAGILSGILLTLGFLYLFYLSETKWNLTHFTVPESDTIEVYDAFDESDNILPDSIIMDSILYGQEY